VEPVPPRKRDRTRTKAQILDAARRAFSARGYAQVSLRQIAQIAGTDPALVQRYFSSKLGLFEAALAETLRLDELLAAPRERIGEHIAALLADDKSEELGPLPMLLMAVADPVTRPVALQQLEASIMDPLAHWIGGPQGDILAARMSMLCSGFFTYTRLLPVKAFSNGIDQETLRLFARGIQKIVDEGIAIDSDLSNAHQHESGEGYYS